MSLTWFFCLTVGNQPWKTRDLYILNGDVSGKAGGFVTATAKTGLKGKIKLSFSSAFKERPGEPLDAFNVTTTVAGMLQLSASVFCRATE